MSKSILHGKHVLAVDDETDVLEIIEEELQEYGVRLDTAPSYEEGLQKLTSLTYDLVILDIMGVRGFDLLQVAVSRDLPVVMLTAHALSPDTLKKSIALGARAYLPKDQLGRIAPFLGDALTLNYRSGWKSVLEKLGASFGKRFGPQWRTSEKEFWEHFDKEPAITKFTIIQS
ncbi:MAG: response regulator [Deltaproteobacteria bacterium]|nr:response regulator [Deltaproteobacteria bacterium]